MSAFTRTQINVGLGAQFLTNRESGLWWVFRVSVPRSSHGRLLCSTDKHTVCNHRPSGVLLSVRSSSAYPAGVKVSCLLRQPQESVGPTRQLKAQRRLCHCMAIRFNSLERKQGHKTFLTIHACMFRIFHIHVLKLKSQSV